MKKFLSYIIVFLCIFFICDNVEAVNHRTLDLIPISETSSVDTEHFYYSDISYSSSSRSFNIAQVKNKSSKSAYLGSSILLFDENSINIGFISYCSRTDLDGVSFNAKASSGGIGSLTIYIKDSYLLDGKSAFDIKYYSILDDNFNCRSLDSNKFEGLTIEEIRSGKVSKNYQGDKYWLSDFFKEFTLKDLITWLIVFIVLDIIVSVVVALLYGKILKKGLFLSFVPVVNMLVSIKLAFGNLALVLSTLFLIISVFIFMYTFNYILLIVFVVAFIASYIVCIYKLFTGNYNSFLLFNAFKKRPKNVKRVVNSNDVGNQAIDLTFTNVTNESSEKIEFDANFDSVSQSEVKRSDISSLGTDKEDGNIKDIDVTPDLNLDNDSNKDDNEENPWGF